ncbi:4-(cytidine 5'-diphospho)-2-C-methyl-D-erythritol kinase [Candidatus Sumerlaeota bacterium]|nr:4-(cytidine 5'-diphospho)-2-C-methyl-D-erythritol kinase [Candidatus Sumerlaeales bacterium]NLD61134.1 4-(cytidine 5'-diphospho)-2-C-methyl-D-erythritol kinase [Candidatus Sumerlaeota bacterium]
MKLTLQSYAKINWYLEVKTPPRDDGFHDIVTVFQMIDLSDTLEFEVTGGETTIVDGMPNVPMHENLIWQAWDLLRRECGDERVRPIHVHVDKRIPLEGGMGGGSSNAAETLRAVNDLFDLRLSRGELVTYAARLGSDCPFFLLGHCAMATGRGEILTPIEGVPSRPLLLEFPSERVSTALAYKALDLLGEMRSSSPIRVREFETCLQNPASTIDELTASMYNDFEAVVKDVPWYVNACHALTVRGGRRPMLCGSGSTLFALAERNAVADAYTLPS